MTTKQALQALEALVARSPSPAVDVFVTQAVRPFRAIKAVPNPILQEALRKLEAALRSSIVNVAPVHWLEPEQVVVRPAEYYEDLRFRPMVELLVRETWRFDGKRLYLPALHAAVPTAYLRDFAAVSSQHIRDIYGALLEGVTAELRDYYEHGQQQGSRRARELLAEPAVVRELGQRSAELSTYGVKIAPAQQSHLYVDWILRARIT